VCVLVLAGLLQLDLHGVARAQLGKCAAADRVVVKVDLTTVWDNRPM